MSKVTILLLLTMLAFAHASPHMLFRPAKRLQDESSASSFAPSATQKQTSRQEIIRRARVKDTRRQVDAAQKRALIPALPQAHGTLQSRTKRVQGRALAARASAVRRSMKREECANGPRDDDGTKLGVARYLGWELEYDDIPHQSLEVPSEAACIHACTLYGPGCAGSQFLPENEGLNCYLKSPSVTTGIFTKDSEDAEGAGTALSLVGSCDYWTQNVPTAMDSICCDS